MNRRPVEHTHENNKDLQTHLVLCDMALLHAEHTGQRRLADFSLLSNATSTNNAEREQVLDLEGGGGEDDVRQLTVWQKKVIYGQSVVFPTVNNDKAETIIYLHQNNRNVIMIRY